MRAVVTGATGFIGGHVAARLVAEGWEVVGLGRDAARGAALARIGVRFARVDLTDAAGLAQACAGADAVVHGAALAAPWGPAKAFEEANVRGTARVLGAARAAGAGRIVHLSSPAVYFNGRDQLDIREDRPFPRSTPNAYVASKRGGDLLAQRLRAEGAPVVILRPRAVIGRGDSAILPRLVRLARRGWLPLIDGGRAIVDLTCVENVAQAVVLALAADPRAIGGVYNVTNGEPRTVRSLLERVAAAAGRPVRWIPLPHAVAWLLAGVAELCARLTQAPEPPLTRYGVALLSRCQTLDLTAARRDLGYVPELTLEAGLNRALQEVSDGA